MTDVTAAATALPVLDTPLDLPCGARLANRLAKAATTEGLGDGHNDPTDRHVILYRRWSAGGAGLLLTGNVFVDRAHLERAGNVAIDGDPSAEKRRRLSAWAAAATASGNHCWMQVNHAGRVTPGALNPAPLAPSAVQSPMPGTGAPVEMSDTQIRDAIRRFGRAAAIARDCGFTGVQLHGAHGYLTSQFLTPSVNRRGDEWGGSLENRARFLIEALKEIRRSVGADFPVSAKLNSADFQKGGFTFAECRQVVAWLNPLKLDLLEISGGNFEHFAYFAASARADHVQREEVRESTRQREAYFIDYAAEIAAICTAPLMVTGGFRSRAAMDEALRIGAADVIGAARPFCAEPDAAAGLLSGALPGFTRYEDRLRLGRGWLGHNSRFKAIRDLNTWGTVSWFYTQIHRIADGLEPMRRPKLLSSLRYLKRKDAEAIEAHLATRRP